ncbi:hypothetical protein AXF42_Ash006200 [Apostasia shenzhenica]|uniref:Uncharacterized protein n=1 Tax=Apostasia shenzhenica TaxID=1088818 RepID=A0A2I0B0H1_9ASPA|nr:hypothetical protein AXF42_Ash006200 [Apostasia shenzhenica]
MVGDSLVQFPFSLSKKRVFSGDAATRILASSAAPFASCMQGWHYRCLGLDP